MEGFSYLLVTNFSWDSFSYLRFSWAKESKIQTSPV